MPSWLVWRGKAEDEDRMSKWNQIKERFVVQDEFRFYLMNITLSQKNVLCSSPSWLPLTWRNASFRKVNMASVYEMVWKWEPRGQLGAITMAWVWYKKDTVQFLLTMTIVKGVGVLHTLLDDRKGSFMLLFFLKTLCFEHSVGRACRWDLGIDVIIYLLHL